jgi:hypothetical protein
VWAVRRPLSALVLALALLSPTVAHAGPWTQPAGEAYLKVWLKYLYGFGFQLEGQTFDYGPYHELFLNAYGEVGLVDGLTLTAHVPLLQMHLLRDPVTGSLGDHFTFGDSALGLRARVLRVDRFVASAEVGVRLPFGRTGPQQRVLENADGFPEIGALQIGAGAFDVSAGAGVGYGWDHGYVAGGAAYVLRTEGFDHVLTWTAEGGGTVDEVWGLRVRLTGYHSLGVTIGPAAPGHRSPSGIGNGTNYMGFALEADRRVGDDLWVGLTLEGGLGALNRQTGGPVVSVYLAHRLGP